MIKPIFIHCRQDSDYDERFDTTMMPNGSVAALCQIAEDLRSRHHQLLPSVAIDEQYIASGIEHGQERSHLLSYLNGEIEQLLSQGYQPAIFCTLFSYNAEGTLELLRCLKGSYGSRIRTAVGGQLVRVAPNAYLNNPHIDHVGVGDAEVVLESLLVGGHRFASGYLTLDDAMHYSRPSYRNYVGLQERLDEVSRYRLGPFTGIRQLVTESVRGCSWAYFYKICKMCSLMGVKTEPRFKPFHEHFQIERDLVDLHGCNWLFDVSNQWLPAVRPKEIMEWMQSYLAARRIFGEYEINRYIYLTTNSITQDTAPLLREAGVRIVYVGVDGWDRSTLTALHKTQSGPRKMLEAARDAGLYIRTSLVIGSGLTNENLASLPEFVGEIAAEFSDVILSWGNFLEIILPGSPVWYDFQKLAQVEGLSEVCQLYEFFERTGYLTWIQQERLTELYIRHTQPVDYEAVVESRDRAKAVIDASSIIGITIRDGGSLEST